MNINNKIEHTLLNPSSKRVDIMLLCHAAKDYKFRSICINPEWVYEARKQLRGTDIRIVQVYNFPTSRSKLIIGDEVDIFIKVAGISQNKKSRVMGGRIIEGTLQFIEKHGIDRKNIKVIIETRVISKKDLKVACRILMGARVGYIKSSTGLYNRINDRTNLDDLKLIKNAIRLPMIIVLEVVPFSKIKIQTTNKKIIRFLSKLRQFTFSIPFGLSFYKPMIKIAGGIKTRKDAEELLKNGADLIGCSKSTKITSIKGDV